VTALLTELKTRARLRLNAARPRQPALRLRDCLNQVAMEVGFAHWDHARRVLGGEARAGDDMGRFWHAPACNTLLNAWFANHADACSALALMPGAALLPYQRQFVLASGPFIRELGLDPHDAAWTTAGHDLVRAYGTDPWRALAMRRLKAAPSTFARR
jgi:hypothetical protein